MRPERGEVDTLDEADARDDDDSIDVTGDVIDITEDRIDDPDDTILNTSSEARRPTALMPHSVSDAGQHGPDDRRRMSVVKHRAGHQRLSRG